MTYLLFRLVRQRLGRFHAGLAYFSIFAHDPVPARAAVVKRALS